MSGRFNHTRLILKYPVQLDEERWKEWFRKEKVRLGVGDLKSIESKYVNGITAFLVKFTKAYRKSKERPEYFSVDGVTPSIEDVGVDETLDKIGHGGHVTGQAWSQITLPGVTKLEENRDFLESQSKRGHGGGHVTGHVTTHDQVRNGKMKLRGWQLEVERMLKEDPWESKSIWIWDKIKGSGKTFLRHYLYEQGDCVDMTSKSLRKIAEEFEEGCRIGVYDTHGKRFSEEMLDWIEQFKDGIVCINDKTYSFDRPHILILSDDIAPDMLFRSERGNRRWKFLDLKK